ncbi:helix-turn-helix transcriptional regulator [Streptomyces sp. NPDC021056]|uniref:response regulator transcription factor n=1 Tax=Streptomyces sp. NPDC021056 TaxID=3155012 RepID=UPI0033DB2E9C
MRSRRLGSFGDPLTERQATVLRLASEGLTHRQVAHRMGIEEKSVSYLVSAVLVRLGADNMTHAVLLGCRAGILDGRPQRHGDHAGFAAHERRGEDPWACESCAEGERAYRRDRRAARKTRTS